MTLTGKRGREIMKKHKLVLDLSPREARVLYKTVLAGLQSGALNSHQKNLACLLAVRIRDLEAE
jgi:hypothetical protein